jgi:hypothetical protein
MKTMELLENLKTSTKIITDTVETDFSKLSDQLLNWKENPSRWSVLECMEHLNRYNEYYLKAIEVTIAGGSPSKGGPLASTWIGRKSIAMMHPSNLKKQKTFKKMNPANGNLTRKTLDKFLRDQDRLLNLITSAQKVDINSSKVPVEFFKLLKMTLGEALEFVVVHEQRHLIQAKKVVEKIGKTQNPALAI